MWFSSTPLRVLGGVFLLISALLGLLAPATPAQAEIRCAGKQVEWRVRSKTTTGRSRTLRASTNKNAFAVSRQRITNGTGCVSFSAPGSAVERVIGMSQATKVAGIKNFVAAVHLKGKNKFSLIIDGQESDQQWSYRSGDRFFISANGGNLEFWHNGQALGSAVVRTDKPLFFAAALKKTGASVGMPRMASGNCKRWLRNGTCARTSSPLTPIPTGGGASSPEGEAPVPPATTVPSAGDPAVPPSAPPSTPPGSGLPNAKPTPAPTPISGTVYYVSPSGNDSNNGTSVSSAWRTVGKAASSASANSTVLIRSGTYNETLTINRSNITFQGYPGDAKPVITSSTSNDTSTIVIGTGARSITLKDLNISGGYYSVKFDSSWSNGGGGTGPQNILIDGCSLHDSASHVIKIQPKANYITIQNSEIYRSGRRSGLEGQGVDAVNASNFTFQDNYVHDTTHTCLFTKGGAVNSLVQRNAMINCGWSGILLGQDTGRSFMDSATNPNLYECIDCAARNNIVINTGYAGIGSYSASGTRFYNNTVVNAARVGQAGIWLASATVGHGGPAGTNYDIQGNIITMNAANRQALGIASGAYSGTPTMNHNIYYSAGGSVTFVDNRGGGSRSFSAWRSATGQDANSVEAEPSLTGPQIYGNNVYPSASSPAVNRFPNASSSGYSDDYFHVTRPSGVWDSGAVQH